MADLISQQGLYQDGNSIFENVHILGALNVTGIVNTETTVKASKFIGDGSELTGIDATTIKDSAGTIRIQGTTTGATHSGRAVFTEVEITGKLYDADGDFGTSGQVLSSDGTNTNWVNTGSLTAGAASDVGITAVNTDSDHFITFVDSSTGNDNIKVDTDLKYNPSSNTIATIKINDLQVVGELKDGDGNFGGAGTVLTSDGTDTKWDNIGSLAAGSAAKISVSEDDTETDGRLLFSNAAGQSGGNVVKSDNDLTYNANTNTLTVTNITGTASAATQAVNLNNHSTDDLSEGSSNLYFTDTRSRDAISVTAAGTPSGAGSLSYDSSTGQLTFTPAAAVGEPTTISVNDESSDTTCFPLFGTAATGSIAPKTGSNLTFNSADGTLTANNFSGGGANLSNLDADNLSSGSLPSARLSGSYANTVTIGDVRIGAWTGGATYKGIFHTSQGGAAYMIMSNNTATYISASPSQPVYIRYGSNDSTNQLVIGSGNDALTWRGNKVFHAGNDGSGSGLDADTLDGAQPSVSAGNNTIVQRHSSGYIFANYFNTTPNDVSSGVTKVCVETGNDGYIRHGDTSAIQTFINASTAASNNTIVKRHSSGYIFSNYINTTDNSQPNSVTGLLCKAGDDYHRTATASAVRSFLNVADGATNTPNITPKVNQVLSTTTTSTQYYQYYQGHIDTGLSITINCADANNKIHIEYTIYGAATTGNNTTSSRPWGSRLLRNNSQIAGGTGGSSGNESAYSSTPDNFMDCHAFSYIDTPGAGNHTYKVQIRHHLSASYSNRLTLNRDRSGNYRAASTLTCSEIVY